MKITAIQQALQTLGFLPPSHALGGDWDALTNAGYIQAAQADNLHPSLHAQPSHPDQLPRQVRALMEGAETEPQQPQAPVNTGPTADELAAEAAAKAAAEEAERAEAQRKAEAQDAADAEAAAKAAAEAAAAQSKAESTESEGTDDAPNGEQDGE